MRSSVRRLAAISHVGIRFELWISLPLIEQRSKLRVEFSSKKISVSRSFSEMRVHRFGKFTGPFRAKLAGEIVPATATNRKTAQRRNRFDQR